MFFNNRKSIYLILVVILVIGAFLGGKKVGTGTVHATQVVKKAVVTNIHYNDTQSVVGTKYSIDYSILNALFLNKNSMQFDINLINNIKVSTIKVIAKDQDNNNLQINANASADTTKLLYTVSLDTNTTKVNIFVYPLTSAMAKNKKLDINTIPFKSSNLDVKLLKQQQIQSLQN